MISTGLSGGTLGLGSGRKGRPGVGEAPAPRVC